MSETVTIQKLEENTEAAKLVEQTEAIIQSALKNSTEYPSLEECIVRTPETMRLLIRTILDLDNFDYEKDLKTFPGILCRALGCHAANFEYELKRLEIDNFEDAKAYTGREEENADGTIVDKEHYLQIIDAVANHVNNAQDILTYLMKMNFNAAPKDGVDFLEKTKQQLWRSLEHSVSGSSIWYNLHKARELASVLITGVKNDYALVADIESLMGITDTIIEEIDREREEQGSQFFEPEKSVSDQWFAHEMIAEADNDTIREVILLLLDQKKKKRNSLNIA